MCIRATSYGCRKCTISRSERVNFAARGIAVPSQPSVEFNGKLGRLFSLGLQARRSEANQNRERAERYQDWRQVRQATARRPPRFDRATGVQPWHPRILVEIEIANRFFDRSVFGLLQTFGEFSGEHVFLRLLGLHRRPELCLDGLGLPP